MHTLAEFLNLVIKVTRTDLMRLAPLLIRKSTQTALLNQRKPLLICTIFSFCHRCRLLLMLFGVDIAQAPNDLK